MMLMSFYHRPMSVVILNQLLFAYDCSIWFITGAFYAFYIFTSTKFLPGDKQTEAILMVQTIFQIQVKQCSVMFLMLVLCCKF